MYFIEGALNGGTAASHILNQHSYLAAWIGHFPTGAGFDNLNFYLMDSQNGLELRVKNPSLDGSTTVGYRLEVKIILTN